MTSFLPPEDLAQPTQPTAPEPTAPQRTPTPTELNPGSAQALGGLLYPHNEADIETFMEAMRTFESRGKYSALGPVQKDGSRARGAYQIMDKFWDGWAREAGLAGADWRDPAAQDAVARYKMTQYFRELGDWRLVAVAWFAGLGTARIAKREGFSNVANMKDSLGTTVANYVGAIAGYMEDIKPGSMFPQSDPFEIPTDALGPAQAGGTIGGPGFQFVDPFSVLTQQPIDNDPDQLTGREVLTHILNQASLFVAEGSRSPLGNVEDDLAVFDPDATGTELRSAEQPEELP